MKVTKLSYEEQIATGFSHKAVIPYTDLTAAATTQTIQLAPSGSATFTQKVVVLAAARVATAFAGPTTVTVQLGDTGSTNRNLAASDIKATAGTWYSQGAAATLNAFNTAGSFNALFTSTGANLSTCSAGQVELYFTLIPLERLLV